MQLPIPLVQQYKAEIQTYRSKRARIMKALQLILQTITKDNGYTITVQEVSFDVKGWRDKTEDQTPVIYIIDSNTTMVKHAGCVREYTWQLPIFGVAKGIGIIPFEEFISDLEEAIYDNNTLLGEVNKTEIEQVLTDNQLFSELNETGHHLFELTVSAEYTRHARNPR